MTNNEKDAHTAAYNATRRLALTRDKTYRVYVAAKTDYIGSIAEFSETYNTIFENTLADLEAK
jgi:hypothetical protein